MRLGTSDDPFGRKCPFCKGNGRCAKCDGTGTRLVRAGFFGRAREADCRACEGSGECQLCHGLAASAAVRVSKV